MGIYIQIRFDEAFCCEGFGRISTRFILYVCCAFFFLQVCEKRDGMQEGGRESFFDIDGGVCVCVRVLRRKGDGYVHVCMLDEERGGR